jgi:hypothetical protein
MWLMDGFWCFNIPLDIHQIHCIIPKFDGKTQKIFHSFKYAILCPTVDRNTKKLAKKISISGQSVRKALLKDIDSGQGI